MQLRPFPFGFRSRQLFCGRRNDTDTAFPKHLQPGCGGGIRIRCRFTHKPEYKFSVQINVLKQWLSMRVHHPFIHLLSFESNKNKVDFKVSEGECRGRTRKTQADLLKGFPEHTFKGKCRVFWKALSRGMFASCGFNLSHSTCPSPHYGLGFPRHHTATPIAV